ncbi:Putative DNA-binding protein [Nocardiopsis sp. JB363]|nr:Putative DNA-binding protein [Nocardiopsis sp. JB363]
MSLLGKLCQLYDASSSVRGELFALWQDSDLPPWWEHQNLRVSAEDERTALGVRADAQRVHGWAEALVPELLRTADYTRVIADAMGVEPQMAVAVCSAAQRRARQRGVEQRYVVDETVIRRPVGGPQVMADQISVLRGLAAQGRLRVLAWESGHYPLDSAFELCSVPGLDTVLYHPRARTIHTGGAFGHHDVFIRLWGQAEEESATLALLDDAHTRLSATTTATLRLPGRPGLDRPGGA